MKRSAQYDTAIPQMELRANGSHGCLLRGRKHCLQPVPHRGYDFHQLSGLQRELFCEVIHGSLEARAYKPYQPQSLNPPAFTHQLAEKIPWVWKPKRMLFVQLGSAPRANRQFKWVSDSNCAGNPKSGTITYCLLHSTTSRPAAWGWGNGRQRGVELLQGENRENEGPISQQDPWGYNSSITGSLSYTKATSPRHQIK